MQRYFKFIRGFCSRRVATLSNDHSKIAQYPPIFDTNPKEIQKRKTIEKHRKYDTLNTVEEKLFSLNLDKYYGWNSLILKEGDYPYNILPFVKFITRTHLVSDNKDQFHKVQNVDINDCKGISEKIRGHLQEILLFELKGRKRDQENLSLLETQDAISKNIIESINRLIISYLSSQYTHLLHAVIDYQPRVEAFWMVGSFHPSNDEYEDRKEKDLNDDEKSELVDHWIQYFGAPVVQLRHKLPLAVLQTEYLKTYNDPENSSPLSSQNYNPSLAYGLQFQRRHGTNIPGYWPGDENEFGLLTYHSRGHLLDRPPHFGQTDHDNTLLAQSILANYAWLLGQATYQGFSTFTDLTYPLVSQNVITDGRLFNFSIYQLNTTLLHSDHSLNNPRINVSISLPTSPLYQEINGNEFIGWNDDVLSTLISFYLNEPKERGIELKPYLDSKEKYVADIEDEGRRVWFHKQFRHMYSNRSRHRLPYEIYDWERIYKVKFPTRAFDARLRPFELDSNPLEDRKYSDHMPPYIPRNFRPRKKHWTGWRSKFAKTYYPDI